MTSRPLHLLGSPVLRQRAANIARVDDEVRVLSPAGEQCYCITGVDYSEDSQRPT